MVSRAMTGDDWDESWSGAEMKHESEVLSQSLQVVADLPLTMSGQVFGRFELDYDRPFNQEIASMKTDLLTPERHGDWEFAVHL